MPQCWLWQDRKKLLRARQYRGRRDLTDFPGYLAPRVMDKLAIALLIMTCALLWRSLTFQRLAWGSHTSSM